jgi:hypothetical protein
VVLCGKETVFHLRGFGGVGPVFAIQSGWVPNARGWWFGIIPIIASVKRFNAVTYEHPIT